MRYARRDALRMAKSLQRAAGFDRILLRTQAHTTTRDALLQSFAQLKQIATHPDDTVFVYLSGHGTVAWHPTHKAQERYILTSDTTDKVVQTGLSVQRVIGQLRGLRSKKVVLMLATCYTGSPRSKARVPAGSKGQSKRPTKALRPQAIQILSATGFAQAAFESEQLRADVYTHFFLRCLHKLRRKQGRVSAIDAHVCAAQPTAAYVKKHIHEIQVPRVDSQPGANRDVWLTNRKKSSSKLGHVWTGMQRNRRYALRPLARRKGRWQGSAPPQRLTPESFIGVRPGRYEIIVRDQYGRLLRRYTITVRQQQVMHVTPAPHVQQIPGLQQDFVYQRSSLVWSTYVVGGIVFIGGASTLVLGAMREDGFRVIGGGMIAGAGTLMLLGAFVADYAAHHSQRKIFQIRQQRLRRPRPQPHTPAPVFPKVPDGLLSVPLHHSTF